MSHTDTTYFSEPAGLQAFHLLSHQWAPGKGSSSGVRGGESTLVDGFCAASILRKEDARHFETLSRTPVPWHASGNEGVSITPDLLYPVFELEDEVLFRVRWNNDDRGVMGLQDGLDGWYAAASHWQQILERDEMRYHFQLEPGRVLSKWKATSRSLSLFDKYRYSFR